MKDNFKDLLKIVKIALLCALLSLIVILLD